jgi:hypothetical protein
MSLQWLVRTEKNQILGPFSKEVLQEMVQTRQVSQRDEVCESLGYWIAIEQTDELFKCLGVKYPEETEKTETGLEKTKFLEPHEREAPTEPALEVNTGVISLQQFRQSSSGVRASARVISPVAAGSEPTEVTDLEPEAAQGKPAHGALTQRKVLVAVVFGLVLLGFLVYLFWPKGNFLGSK